MEAAAGALTAVPRETMIPATKVMGTIAEVAAEAAAEAAAKVAAEDRLAEIAALASRFRRTNRRSA